MPISEYYRNLREKAGTELLMVPSVAAVIRNEEGNILLLRKGGGPWGLPAGAVEPGETPSRAVRREVFEEAGLMVTPQRVLGVFGGDKYTYIYENGDKVAYSIVVFACSVVKGTPRSFDGEADEFRFFTEEELPELSIPYPHSIFVQNNESDKAVFE
ncbi:NUDIX domain-containing protein [Paenibacillus tengchongensis]|uniref:NUDIX domain-containing protein n=1 Tax=Paenibacillus tengchongensis TaxID=2608684 RepID=UPI00124E959F|nr:NUDIX domain-containing protein [Paenibacillus tengchongensis]